MDIQLLAGYPSFEHREMTDDPVAWLSSPVKSAYSSQWWRERFVSTFAQSMNRFNTSFLSYRDFVLQRWLWSTGGATSLSHALLDGAPVRTKFGAALSLSDEELLRVALDVEPKIGVFLKPDEMGYKRRLIANVTLGGYLAAAYVRYLLEHFVGSSPIFTKLEVGLDETLDVCQLVRDRRVMMPLDESAYDYHVSRESWEGFFSFLTDSFGANVGVVTLKRFFDTAYWSWDGKVGSWLSGMPSGLALTSFLNSWMNYIKQVEVSPGLLQWAAGDDVLVAPYDPKPLEQISEQYALFGSELNAQKNWISTRYAEYLKVVYTFSGTGGYPARVFASLMWAGQERSFLPSDRLPELAELWKQYFDRLAVPFDEVRVSRDLSRAVSQKVVGFNSVVAREWLHSPRAYGGFGRLPYNDTVFDWSAVVLKKKKYTDVIIRVPDVNFYAPQVQLRRRREPLLTASFKLGPPLRLPLPRTMEEWESRLNGEDNPVKGRFGRMALDLVPLPSIDFVSTARMSSFAARWGYNVYPNLVGRTDRIVARLVTASLALVDDVVSWMSANGLATLAN